jgi:hypothetical protein
MNLLTRLAMIEGGILLVGFFAVVALRIVTGEISLAGLLTSKDAHVEHRTFSPARLQLLIFTVAVAATYLYAIVVNPQQSSLPDLPQGVVAALGGSQAFYLAGKALAAYIQPLHRNRR